MNTNAKTRFVLLASLLLLLGAVPAVILAEGPGGSGDGEIYLPITLKDVELPGSISGTLVDGGVFEGPDGVGIGAITNTLTAPVEVWIGVAAPPTLTIPAPAQALGSFYQIGAHEAISLSPDTPFLLSLPVPTGANTTTLALAYLGTGVEVADADPDLQAWLFQEGFYDANRGSFLTTMATLGEGGRTFLLVEHPDFESPPNTTSSTQNRPATPSAFTFNVNCVHFSNPADCTTTIENTVEDFLSDMSDRIQQDLGFGDPRLRNLAENLQFNPNSLSSLGYTAYIEPHTYGFCNSENAGGYFARKEGRLVLCLNPAVGLDPDYVHILIHEYFHATQYGYEETYNDFAESLVPGMSRKDKDWIIEGMAKAAEESYFADEMIRSKVGGTWVELHKVDRPLALQNGKDEYFAQDFWVLYGQMFGHGMEYFQDILVNGATTEDAANALGDGERIAAYWDWAKNQAMEKGYDFDGELGSSCVLETQVVDEVEFFPFIWNAYIAHDVILDPLTSIVVEVDFDFDYDFAAGWVQPTDPSQSTPALQALEYKFYKDGESGCESIPDGDRTYVDVSTSDTYYVLISNTDIDDQFSYRILFEFSPFPPTMP